jgi:uncharacterized protein YbcV (DUF1398 family)
MGLTMINITVINDCTNMKLPFPKVVQTLLDLGIERYYTDLIRLEKTYYSHSNESCVEQMSIENLPAFVSNFDIAKIVEAIRSSQDGQIDYYTFIKHIIAAGTVSYTVYLDGKQVIYAGRKGEFHTEHFHF